MFSSQVSPGCGSWGFVCVWDWVGVVGMWNWKMRAAGFIGGLAVVFGFVALPAHSDESVTVPVPLVDAVAVSHYGRPSGRRRSRGR